jgi:uncharacterized phage protein (TIGR01671 family)
MRELKFRVWDHDLKEFIEDSNADPHICWNGTVYCYERQKEGGDVLVSGIRNLTVQQYTGMIDKDGKEIYEGDIIFGKVYYGSENGIGIVVYFTGSFIVDWRNQIDDPLDEIPDIKVIGNIFENPALFLKYEN